MGTMPFGFTCLLQRPAYGAPGPPSWLPWEWGIQVSWSPFFVGMVPWTAMEPSSQFLVKGCFGDYRAYVDFWGAGVSG